MLLNQEKYPRELMLDFIITEIPDLDEIIEVKVRI